MRSTVLALAAALLFVAACESTPEETGSTATTGTSTSSGVGIEPGGGYGRPTTGSGNYGNYGNYSSAPVTQMSPAQMQKVQQELVEVGDRVFFAYDSYGLDDKAKTTLDGQAAFLNHNPSVTVTIEGHCDERGTREYNLALGERRASSVKDYLTAVGVSPGRIRTISYGSERPAVLGSTESAYAQNRRAVTVIVGGAGS